MSNRTEQLPVRRLGTWAAIAMVVSEVVGVGIFLTPATMTRTLGSLSSALIVWAVMAALTTAGALCFAELATRWPRAGGAYVFIREGFGLRCAVVYGWMLVLVIDPGLVAVLGLGLARYLTEVLGLSVDQVVPLALSSILLFGLFTTLGVRASAQMMMWTAGVKFAVVVLLIVVGIAHASPSEDALAWTNNRPPAGHAGALASAVFAAFFAFGGWWEIGRMGEEVKSPRRTIPRALLGGVALVTAIYALVTVSFMLVAPSLSGPSDEAFVRAMGAVVFGEAASSVLPALVVVAISGTLAAVLLRAPRAYLAMARDGVLPQRLARFDPTRGVCATATLVQVGLASALVLTGSFDTILGYFVPGTVFFVGLAAAAVLRLPRPDRDSPVFRMPWYPLPVGVFLVTVVSMLIVFVLGYPAQTLLGACAVVLGLAAARVIIISPPDSEQSQTVTTPSESAPAIV